MKIVRLDKDSPLINIAIENELKINKSHFINPSKNTINYLLIDEGVIVGGVDYSFLIDEAEILFLYVVEEEREKGYSKYLLKNTFSMLKDMGVKKIFLEVNVNNHIAMGLYRKVFGFEPINIRKKYYNNSEDAMSLWVEIWLF